MSDLALAPPPYARGHRAGEPTRKSLGSGESPEIAVGRRDTGADAGKKKKKIHVDAADTTEPSAKTVITFFFTFFHKSKTNVYGNKWEKLHRCNLLIRIPGSFVSNHSF